MNEDLYIYLGVIHILCSIKIEVRWTPHPHSPYVTLFCNVNSMVVTLSS